MQIVCSLAAIPERKENLSLIVGSLLPQCDSLFVNLINFERIPKCLHHSKIITNHFRVFGSEVRFFDYSNCDNETYYFTVDDDILYPENYVSTMLAEMKKLNNDSVVCVHGSRINLQQESDFYMNGREVFHFMDELRSDTVVMLPGVGTSCFYRGKAHIDLNRFEHKNMSDVFVGCLMAEQKIPIISLKRPRGWLKQLHGGGKNIWRSNPKTQIDLVIRDYKKHLVKINLSSRG